MLKNQTTWFPGAIYHVSCSCRFQTKIFRKEHEYLSYLSLLEQIRYQYPFYLHSYCLLSNHIQFLIETTHIPIQDIMKKLNNAYSSYLLGQNDRRCFLSTTCMLIDSVEEFLIISKSIHLAPKNSTEKTSLKSYRWSSYRSFITPNPNDHVVTSRVLTYFPEPKQHHYSQFVEEKNGEATILKREEFVHEPSNFNR